jgi:thiol-disulfide isomerase/thioredoxin
LKGKVVVINCWFYGCAPCIAEIPALNQLAQKYENQAVEFIALTRDSKEALAKYFFPKYDFKFQIVVDADSIIQEELKMLWGYPTTMIFDKTGKLQHIVSGGFMGDDVNEKTLQRLIPMIDGCLK